MRLGRSRGAVPVVISDRVGKSPLFVVSRRPDFLLLIGVTLGRVEALSRAKGQPGY